jgi:transposase-like protein
MTQRIAKDGRPRPRRRRCHRWTPEEKARYLAAFRRSGTTVIAFCRAMDLSPITFAQWQREARRQARQPARAEVTASTAFARVEVVPVVARARAITTTGTDAMRLVVRGATGHEAALDGVDPATAIRVVALVLGAER